VILIDTSIWVDHLHQASSALTPVLKAQRALGHPAVIGELACGSLRQRRLFLSQVMELPRPRIVRDEEVIAFIDRWRLWGRGLSWVDAHLLAACSRSGVMLWTRDRRLIDAAEDVGADRYETP